jgi:hypothetical protein
MFWSWSHAVLIKGNKQTNIEYNINYIKGIWVIKRGFFTLIELEKIFYLFSISIDCEILSWSGMTFEKKNLILFKESMTIMLRTKMI